MRLYNLIILKYSGELIVPQNLYMSENSLTLVSQKKQNKRTLTNFPYMNLMKGLYSRGFLSSTSSGVNVKLRSSPFSLQIRWSLNPKNQPTDHLPFAVIPLKTKCIRIL